MALSIDSKIKEIGRSEAGVAVIEKYAPGFFTSQHIKMIQMMTFRKILSFPESAALAVHLEEIDAELKACE
jgi:hypothetical protein